MDEHTTVYIDKATSFTLEKAFKISSVFWQHLDSNMYCLICAKLKVIEPYSWQWLLTISTHYEYYKNIHFSLLVWSVLSGAYNVLSLNSYALLLNPFYISHIKR